MPGYRCVVLSLIPDTLHAVTAYNRKDSYYQRAKEAGYRSRAAYKLIELDDKYKFLKPGFKILDLGSWPGGWLQVAAQRIGVAGRAIGIDLKELEDLELPNVDVLVGNSADRDLLAKVVSMLGSKADLVLSDMAPKLSGIKESDSALSIECGRVALEACKAVLRDGGNLVLKVFKSEDTEKFCKVELKSFFRSIIRKELKSSRNTSDEFYLIGLGFASVGE